MRSFMAIKISRNKRLKFEELAEKRVNRAIASIRLIGNLSNKNNYEFEKNDILKIFSALEKELRSARARFVQAEPKKKKFTI